MDDAPILICYDGSVDARRAIDVALRFLGPRQAIVLTIGTALTDVENTVAPLIVGDDYEEISVADALTRATEGAERARRAGFSATPRGGASEPIWQGIVDVADEIDACVIVVGSRGLTGAREVLDRSVSHKVVQHAGRPVLIVPPEYRGDTDAQTLRRRPTGSQLDGRLA